MSKNIKNAAIMLFVEDSPRVVFVRDIQEKNKNLLLTTLGAGDQLHEEGKNKWVIPNKPCRLQRAR